MKRTVLPLVGTAFELGTMNEAIEQIEDKELAEIARGEMYYFSARASECVDTVKKYLTSEDRMLRLSADMLYAFANLTLGNAKEAQMAREDVRQCLQTSLKEEDSTDTAKAACIFAYYLCSIFLILNRKWDSHLWKKRSDIFRRDRDYLRSVSWRMACI